MFEHDHLIFKDGCVLPTVNKKIKDKNLAMPA